MNKFHTLKYFKRFKTSTTQDGKQKVLFNKNLLKTPTKLKIEKLPLPLYGGRRLVTMLPGRGVGPELTQHVKDVLKVASAPIDFETIELDPKVEETPLGEAITSIKRNGVAIKGNLGHIAGHIHAPNVLLRAELDLFVYLIHYKALTSFARKHPNLDIILIRQNTEGEYAMLEHESVKGVVESLKIMTRDNIERLGHWAFQHAILNKRKRITVVHNIKVTALSDGLFLNTIREISKYYPEIKVDDMYIDRCCRKLVVSPEMFDVMLMPNLYGSIISNTISGLLGGAGLFSGRNYSEYFAIFEPATRHVGLQMAGKNEANPLAMLMASVDMLKYFGYYNHVHLITKAIDKTINEDKIYTTDVGGKNTTSQVIDNIKKHINTNIVHYPNLF